MDITEIASVVGIVAAFSAAAMYWLDLKLKPIKKRLSDLERCDKDLEQTLSLITDGLLANDYIPKRKQ